MKILMLAAAFDIGGAETHILDLSHALIKKGVAVSLISAGGAYVERAERIGVRCILAPMQKQSPASAMKCREIILRELEGAHYDAVHAHTRYAATLAYLILKNRPTPLVVTAHLCFSLGLKRRLSRWGDATLAVSKDIKDYLTKEYVLDERRIILTRNGIDGEVFSKCEPTKKRIIHTSRLDLGRSLTAKLLADAAVKLLRNHPEYEIWIVGDGDDFAEVSSRVRAANEALGFSGVKLLGKRTDVAAILSGAEIFVGVSRAALEAAAVGLAVIISGDEGYGGILTEESFSKMEESNFCARGEKAATKELLFRDIEELILNESLRKTLHGYLPWRIRRDFSTERMALDAIRAYRLAKRNKRRTAALVGYYGYGNLGDEETLIALREILKSRSVEVIYPGSSFGKESKLTKARELARGIRASDYVILGGGNLMQNETSRRSLVYYCEAIRYAARHGKRVFLFSSGLGEINGRLWRRYTLGALSKCELLGLRTSRDMLELDALCTLTEGAQKRAAVRMPDLCFSIPPTLTPKGELVAFILSKDGTLDVREIKRIATESALSPRIISVFRRQDTKRAKEIADALGVPLYFAEDKQSAISLIGECKMAVSERLHGAIFSLIAKTPVFIDTRREKCEALLHEIELTARRSDCRSPLFPISMIDNRQALLSKLSSADFDICLAALRRELREAINNII